MPRRELVLLQKSGELLLEPRQSAAAVDQLLLPASPGRMRFRIDVEVQRVAGLAPGGPGGELRAVGHHHFHAVIVGVGVGFHGSIVPRGHRRATRSRFRASGWLLRGGGSIPQAVARDKAMVAIETGAASGHCRGQVACRSRRTTTTWRLSREAVIVTDRDREAYWRRARHGWSQVGERR